jgi:hypothetical protein
MSNGNIIVSTLTNRVVMRPDINGKALKRLNP